MFTLNTFEGLVDELSKTNVYNCSKECFVIYNIHLYMNVLLRIKSILYRTSNLLQLLYTPLISLHHDIILTSTIFITVYGPFFYDNDLVVGMLSTYFATRTCIEQRIILRREMT